MAALLVACVPLIAILAFQAYYAARSHRAIAEGVLQDYAALAAGELERRARAEIGYRGYSRLVRALRDEDPSSLPGSSAVAAEDEATREAAVLAARFLRYRVAGGELRLEPDDAGGDFRRELIARLGGYAAVTVAGSEGLVGIHLSMADGTTRTVILAAAEPAGALEELVGFEVDGAALGAWLGRAVASGPLLPPSLVEAESGEAALAADGVFVSIAPPSGPPIFRSGDPFEPDLGVDVRLGDAYGGVFEGYRLSVAIDPAVAPRLVIGGLPRSRLPVLLGLLTVTVGLVLAALLLLARERAVDRLRSDFVSRVSHELRTPLTQIRMFAETLLLERTRGPSEARRAVEVIDRESRRLTHLVENLLQFSRGERGGLRLDRRPRRLAPLVREVVEELGPLAAERDTRVSCDLEDGLTAMVDGDAVRQVLLNLLDNALKYGPRGQQIRVGLYGDGDLARLEVEDQGPGVPAAARDRIWRRYHRLERDRRSAVAGTGIGLTVVRELVALHGGRVAVEPAGAAGARFVVELPLAAELAVGAPAPAEAPE